MCPERRNFPPLTAVRANVRPPLSGSPAEGERTGERTTESEVDGEDRSVSRRSVRKTKRDRPCLPPPSPLPLCPSPLTRTKARGSARTRSKQVYRDMTLTNRRSCVTKNFNLFYPLPFGFAERNRKRTSLAAHSAARELSDDRRSIERTGLKRI